MQAEFQRDCDGCIGLQTQQSITGALRLASFLPLALISMAHQPPFTAAKELMKKGGKSLKHFWDRTTGPNSPNASASPSNSNRGSTDSAPGAHDPGLGNDAGSTEPTSSGKFIRPILVLSTTTQPLPRQQWPLESEYVLSWIPFFPCKYRRLSPTSRSYRPVPVS